ncbi:multidrug effflux MFS transporter [Vibrio sp. JC009]|uniref:multidrug effflux MFS transporter n=1 Tax=Vibrio sp. JC009 TaxID=2912314 RepID=UPI0023AFC0E0|nr:multidrug effflux MFS transporter [Vibrio sp. JC009]WED21799.1 multidrug effflux MFS transporter [Vibrio sp. JC009]
MINPSKMQLTMLVLLVLFSPLAIDIYLPALPEIAEVFHVKHTQAQDTISWFLFAMGVGQLFAGPLADKYGRKSIAVSGIVIYGVAAYLASVAANIEWMLASRLLQGVGACATSVAAFATVRDLYGENNSGKMISYLNGAICFIPALAPVLGSYLTQAFGWRSNFTLMALFAVVVLGMVLPLMRETNPKRASGAVFKPSRYLSVLSSGTFLFHALLCMLSMAIILAYVSAAPMVLMSEMGLSMNQFTFWFGINASLNIIAAFSAPKMMARKGTFFCLQFGIVTFAVGAVLMLLMSEEKSPLAFMLPIFLSSIGFSLVLGAAAGKALAPFADKAGTAAALLGLFQMSGSGLLVGLTQRLELEPRIHIAMHMIIVLPALLILLSNKGRQWHQVYNES